MNIGIIVATSRRPAEVRQVVARLLEQTMAPSCILISAVTQADVPLDVGPGVETIFGSAGLCAQRNRAMEQLLPKCDVIVFFDDDFLPARTAVADLHTLFANDPLLAGATGSVLADGVVSGGVSYQDALTILAQYESHEPPPRKDRDTTGLYGCNMAYRSDIVGDLRFDEKLPLYGWQEDNDFAARVSMRGRLVITNAFAGVHLGVRQGRTSGLRLGYSQVANPAYLIQKGTMAVGYGVWLIAKAVLWNHAKILMAEPDIDRAGRARGNRRALVDLAVGRILPERILTLGP